jgi:hypothetical protein
MKNRRNAPMFAVLTALVGVAISPESSAAITVEPPTGSAEPALIEQLRVSVGTVVSGAATAYGVDGSLRMTVDTSEADVTLSLELVPSDGSAPARESRTVARASAAIQARAMAREAIRAVAERRDAASAQAPEGEKGSPQPARDRPALNSPYGRKRALWLSLGPTMGGAVVGGALIGAAFAVPEDGGRVPMLTIGASICGLAFVIGPSLGHFHVHNHRQAALGLALRTVFSAAAPVFFALSFGAGFNAMGGGGSGGEEVFLIFGTIFSAASVISAIIDVTTIPRAVQRANEKAAEEKISAVALAPMLAPGPNGSTTIGLTFSMRY